MTLLSRVSVSAQDRVGGPALQTLVVPQQCQYPISLEQLQARIFNHGAFSVLAALFAVAPGTQDASGSRKEYWNNAISMEVVLPVKDLMPGRAKQHCDNS